MYGFICAGHDGLSILVVEFYWLDIKSVTMGNWIPDFFKTLAAANLDSLSSLFMLRNQQRLHQRQNRSLFNKKGNISTIIEIKTRVYFHIAMVIYFSSCHVHWVNIIPIDDLAPCVARPCGAMPVFHIIEARFNEYTLWIMCPYR